MFYFPKINWHHVSICYILEIYLNGMLMASKFDDVKLMFTRKFGGKTRLIWWALSINIKLIIECEGSRFKVVMHHSNKGLFKRPFNQSPLRCLDWLKGVYVTLTAISIETLQSTVDWSVSLSGVCWPANYMVASFQQHISDRECTEIEHWDDCLSSLWSMCVKS